MALLFYSNNSFRDNEGKIHVTSVHIVSEEKTKFVPTYDSSIPLNPWSKVSMSGYMVARIKKVMPSLVEKMLLRISHVVEKMEWISYNFNSDNLFIIWKVLKWFFLIYYCLDWWSLLTKEAIN